MGESRRLIGPRICEWPDGEVYRVVGRREVWPYAAPRCDDFELFLEGENPSTFTFVGESVLDNDEEDDEEDEKI